MRTLLYAWIPILAMGNWREHLVPSFEADHVGSSESAWEAPGAESFKKVTEALQQLEANNNITEDLLTTLPGLPRVSTFNMTMSDGIQIWTRVVNPWPWNSKKPACLVRSPYGSMATQNLALIFLVLNGHAAVMQETRGTWRSGGVFDMWRGSFMDASDTFNWISNQSWSSGEVYSMGASADGIDAIEEAIGQPKQLHGEWLIWTTGNGHHFAYPGGAYRKDLMLGYFGSLRSVTRGASTQLVLPATEQNEAMGPWWYNLTACGNQSDPSVLPGCRYGHVKWPILLSAGWWDLFHHTMVDAWFGLRADGDPSFRDDHVLIVGPLGHDIAGNLDLSVLEKTVLMKATVDSLILGGELTSEFWKWNKCSDEWAIDNTCKCQGRVRIGKGDTWSEAKLVRGRIKCDTHHFHDPLHGVAKECQCQQATGKLRQRIGRVNLFIMGSFGVEIPAGHANYWTSLDDFPVATAKPLYLSGSAALSNSPPEKSGSSSYQYDPSRPAPMIGGTNLPAIGTIHFCGPANQLPRENRSDVVFFDSAPLPADLPIVGAVSATVFVSSTAEDTDFFVTVSDLHVDGTKSMMVRYGMQRMRWRESEITKSAPMVAGTVYQAKINMGYTAYIFPKGHRIRVSVSSAANPYYVPTSNTGKNDMTMKVDPVVAQNAVYFAPDHPSRVILPVVSMKDIPKNPDFNAVGPFTMKSTEETVV
jgi:hypothetical protein